MRPSIVSTSTDDQVVQIARGQIPTGTPKATPSMNRPPEAVEQERPSLHLVGGDAA